VESKEIILNDLLEKVFFNGKIFARIDIIIRYLAVEYWHNCKQVDALYWKMQYYKLKLKNRLDSNGIINQVNRFIQCVKLFETKEYLKYPIKVGTDFGLIDGAHRLACYMFYNINQLKVDTINEKGKYGTWPDMALIGLFTEGDLKRIEHAKNNTIFGLKKGRWK